MKNSKLTILTLALFSSVNLVSPSMCFANTNNDSAVVKQQRIQAERNPYQEGISSSNSSDIELYTPEMLEEIEKMKQEASRENVIEELFSTEEAMYQTYKSFIISHNPKIQKNFIDKIIKNVKKYSTENKLDPKLVLALIAKESSFRPNAVSHTGAMGLGQLKDFTAREVGVKNPFNISDNIKGTARYLGKLMKHWNGDLYKTIASYNMGAGAVERTLKSGNKLPADVQRYVYKIQTFKSTI